MFSTNDAGEIRYLSFFKKKKAKTKNSNFYLIPYIKINSEWVLKKKMLVKVWKNQNCKMAQSHWKILLTLTITLPYSNIVFYETRPTMTLKILVKQSDL